MTEHDALLNAILADPDDDTARLVYADFIEEAGEAERAAFVRAQLEVARVLEWDPVAVRYRRADLATQAGDRFRSSLPWADAWSPTFPFRRGLGYAIKTRSLGPLLEEGHRLFASAPIGELNLPGGETGEYQEFARQPWLARVRGVRFWSNDKPTEAVRALCASPFTTALESIRFENAISPGMSFLVEALFESHLGAQLRDLSFRVGNGSQLDLIEAFAVGGPPRLERLTFNDMGLDPAAAERFTASPALATLKGLTFRNMFFHAKQIQQLVNRLPVGLESLAFTATGLRPGARVGNALKGLRRCRNLRRLDLHGSYAFRYELPPIVGEGLVGLRSLDLGGIILDAEFVQQLARAPLWPSLVELDLSDNRLTDEAARFLLAAPPPADLVTLDLRGNEKFTPTVREDLRRHFGDAVLLD